MIYSGTKSIQDIYIGTSKVSTIYVGESVAWSASPIQVDPTVIVFKFSKSGYDPVDDGVGPDGEWDDLGNGRWEWVSDQDDLSGEFSGAFCDSENTVIVESAVVNASKVCDSYDDVGLFSYNDYLTELHNITVNRARDLYGFAQGCGELTLIDTMSAPKATTAEYIFWNNSALSTVNGLSVPSLRSGDYMFSSASGLKSIIDTIDYSLLTSTENMYFRCSSLEGDIGDLDLSSATSTASMFSNSEKITSVGNVYAPLATDIDYMFSSCTALTSVGNIDAPLADSAQSLFHSDKCLQSVGNLNFPNATTISFLFYSCTVITSIGTITVGDSLKNVNNIFNKCSALVEFPWFDFSHVKTAKYAFSECPLLTNSMLARYDFSAVTDATCMLYGSNGITNVTLDMPSALNISSMFKECYSLETVSLNAPNHTSADSTFFSCTALTAATFTFNEGCTTYHYLFRSCNALRTINGTATLASCTDAEGMFYDCYVLENIAFADTEYSSVLKTGWMFYYCKKLTTIPALSFPNATRLKSMYCGCESLTSTSINAPESTDSSYLFSNCSALRTVSVGFSRKSTSYASAFANCSALTTLNGTVYLDACTSTVNMFNGCNALTSVTVDTVSAPSLTNTAGMFQNCYALADAPMFDMSHVTNANSMFWNARAIPSIPRYDLSSVINASYMFGAYGGNMNYSGEVVLSMPNVETANAMFQNNNGAASFNLGNCPKLYDAGYMFTNGYSTSSITLTTGELKVAIWMCGNCQYIPSLPGFSVSSSLTDATGMFYNTKNVASGVLNAYNLLAATGSVTTHASTFTNCGANTSVGSSELNQIPSDWR